MRVHMLATAVLFIGVVVEESWVLFAAGLSATYFSQPEEHPDLALHLIPLLLSL